MAGFPGALCTVLGTVIPPLTILSVISFFYAAFRDNMIVSMIMKGMQTGVAAVICDVVLTTGRSILQIVHMGITGGWKITTQKELEPEFLCSLFIFCRYLEQENEFITV